MFGLGWTLLHKSTYVNYYTSRSWSAQFKPDTGQQNALPWFLCNGSALHDLCMPNILTNFIKSAIFSSAWCSKLRSIFFFVNF